VDLKTYFPVRVGALGRPTAWVRAVDGVSFRVDRGETLGLVGESGSGKTTVARTILRLVPATAGRVLFDGQDVLTLPARALRRLRRRMQMVFQDPYASLNPRLTVAEIVGRPLAVQGLAEGRARQARVEELLELVGLEARHARRYPHEFSAGQRQRIGIARALAPGPELLVCDEPMAALDVAARWQLLELLEGLQQRLGLTYLFIAHDLPVVRQVSRRVGVMYLGKVVELAPADRIFRSPLHPYTQALVSAVPVPDPAAERERRYAGLAGEPPSPARPPGGCGFHPRCPYVEDRCRSEAPSLQEVEPGHLVACHLRQPRRPEASAETIAREG
jgi:oligopeptide/dipeptide ABC transporter ATP-binding protein